MSVTLHRAYSASTGTAPSSPERHSPKPKRRKMVIEDDDGDDGPAPSSRELCFVRSFCFVFDVGMNAHTEAPSRSASSSPPPPPPRDEKRKKIKAESSSKAKAKGKAKAKATAAAVVEKEDVDMDGGERAGADESEPDSGEEDAEERKAASKRYARNYLLSNTTDVLACSAEVAMDRRDEMDVPGWKLGDPCVVLHAHRLIALTVLCHRVPYAALANAFALIEATTKRIEKTSLLTSLMLLVIQRSKEGDTDSLLRTVYLCINRVRFFSYAHVCSSG